MIAGLQSRYSMHQNALEKTVESHKAGLPEGMEPSPAHVNMLLRAPHCSTAKVSCFFELDLRAVCSICCSVVVRQPCLFLPSSSAVVYLYTMCVHIQHIVLPACLFLPSVHCVFVHTT